MDYEEINIFELDKFELYSSNRKRSFRFIKYNGDNYHELISYIHELSPNTLIWPENILKVNTLYNYSGRTFRMDYVLSDASLRACIVSNPYRVKSNGEKCPLYITKQQAMEYLQQSAKHGVFCLDKPLSTYKLESKTNKILEFHSTHPKGIDSAELPEGEYYICNKPVEDINRYKCTYDSLNHRLVINVDTEIHALVDNIEELKFQINKNCFSDNGKPLFVPSWQYYEHIKKVQKQCNNFYLLHDIISVLYSYIYEETKEKDSLGQTLKSHNVFDHPFASHIKELKHSISAYINDKDECIKDMCLNFFGINPLCPNDFQKIQLELFKQCVDYFDFILSRVRKPVKGLIQEDDNGILFCESIMLSERFSDYRGCICQLNKCCKNFDAETRDSYPYYCEDLIVYKEFDCSVDIDDRGHLVANEFLFKDNGKNIKTGDPIHVKAIVPENRNGYRRYKGKVFSYEKVGYALSDFAKKYLLYGDEKTMHFIMQEIHKIIDDKQNQEAVFVIRGATDAGLLSDYPSYPDFNKEFPSLVRTKQTYSAANTKHQDKDTTIPTYKKYFEAIAKRLTR